MIYLNVYLKKKVTSVNNEDLSYILRSTKLFDCEYLHDNIYYIKKHYKQMAFIPKSQREEPRYSEGEFLIIADNGIKKAIIFNCDNRDLHWYTLLKWRNQGVLSQALRSGVIKEIWPEIKTVTCCYDWNENKEEKYNMTEHLASLAGLEISEDRTIWVDFKA